MKAAAPAVSKFAGGSRAKTSSSVPARTSRAIIAGATVVFIVSLSLLVELGSSTREQVRSAVLERGIVTSGTMECAVGAESGGMMQPTKDEIIWAIKQLAKDRGLDPAIIQKQVEKESSFNPEAVNKNSGAIGLMQLMPATADSLKVDPNDWKQNLEGGIRYLFGLLRQYGKIDQALAAYNWGPGHLDACIKQYKKDWKDHLPEETLGYLSFILG